MSELRVAFVLIPGEPHFSDVIGASQKITCAMENWNIIDAVRFPPHASLHICTIPAASLDKAFAYLQTTSTTCNLAPVLTIARIRAGSRGYVTCDLEPTPDLRALHEWATRAAAVGRRGAQPGDAETSAGHQGSWRARYQFSPHYSVAKVRDEDQELALSMAKSTLLDPSPASAVRFEVCDIGMRSEKWQTLLRLPS